MTFKGWKYFVFALLFASVASAQTTAVNTSRILWDQEAPTLADAQGYVYKYYPDGGTPILLNKSTCKGEASPFVCEAPFPAFTPGNHTLTLTASNAAGESVQSNPLSFVFIVTPSAPQGIRIG